MDVKKRIYAQTNNEIMEQFATTNRGLTNAEVQERLAKYGPNALEAGKKKTMLQRFLDQFKDFMIIVLMAAALISGLVAQEWADSALIMLVVIINAILGVFQESKAEEAIDALKKMSTPDARVRRDGAIVSIPSDQLVPGDLVLLEAGDVVPADMRLIDVASLKIEESALTGESVPVEKSNETLNDEDVPLGDRINMGYMNSNVTYGRAEGIVTGTGMQTEVGQIAHMINQADETTTPLQMNLNSLGKTLTILILIVAALIFGIGILNNPQGLPMNELIMNMFLVAISLAVAAIPEGLPAIVTIILALGTQKMAKENALVRKLPAVETLGSTDIIASDKTGTLTMNQMTVEKMYYQGVLRDADADIDSDNKALVVMSLANDTKIQNDGNLLGDPTETALIQYGFDHDFDVRNLLKKQPRVQEVPFDSERKLMSTVHEQADGRYLVAVKGAPDELLKRITTVEINGELSPITDEQRDNILQTNEDMAKQALRVLAMAYKTIDERVLVADSESLENNLVFAGLVGMIDPQRPEAAQAVKEAKQAGIRPMMITGDHQITAEAIAVRLGIIEAGDDDAVITGAQLDAMDDATFDQRVGEFSVYARVSPEHKVRIVKAWQKRGKVVAMTGDGVNDAPALKTSDIGIGMGITGTEVSKGASDMVLADDNFATIVLAVKEGRKVFANIQKAIQYLMSANLGEVLTLFFMTILGWDILAPVQLLWINLVTDTFPAIALGVEPIEPGIMQRKPRGRKSNFFSGGVASSIFYQGIIEGALTLGVYLIGLHVGPHVSDPALQHADALTMAYVTLGLIQLFHAFNVKSVHQSLFKIHPFANKMFNLAIAVSFVLLAVTIVVPGFNGLFHVTPLDPIQWAIVIAAGISMLIIVEVVKFVQRKMGKN
ncbi:cation transport ATPase [Amylolactobacillus amylotrophicus DSM 20534]|uniref:P-type Ca(2+) transporter n=3 Tax=Amylolactobacillus TaxID=2767876 RepID=A0A0R1YI94_9LACO|nr:MULTISPECIES: calcium-translocating P-type ATPase, PMCA-type [Amylolactobacillus]APT18852.1 calcium-translocating P-type ATPase, PMCA-type [Amylolactobacillus amylophilus DSM 20533 = JCM 1125]KRK36911.1 cation transport ATPase [Amylolactobacillus amylotrophicus DSM 20534]KRM41953.1 cation transport ATPase [Amylolactobacillus amylophilus DSM 20533 = JCM 1125]GED80935.1 ATPase [Amylolactobacillus amylophilus]